MKSPLHTGHVTGKYIDSPHRSHDFHLDLDNNLHCDDGPAVLYHDGGREWWIHGQKHREGGPAVVHPAGGEEWWWKGGKHRMHAPAYTNGHHVEWWFHSALHREDGPAIITTDREVWMIYGQIHREDGPAIIHLGTKWEEWYQHNELQREDGPATTLEDEVGWYHRGKYHRTDGPAYVDPQGFSPPGWWINGTHAETMGDFKRLAKLTDDETIILTLKYGEDGFLHYAR